MSDKYLIKNFQKRKIEVQYFDDQVELINCLKELISVDCSIGIGNSRTLKDLKISHIFQERGNRVFDKTLGADDQEVVEIKKKSLLTDWYISGSNAVSAEGHIVNIDHSGNRVAALHYGPENVVIIVGKNKIETTLGKALKRAKNTAAPQNAQRAGFSPPCVALGRCIDCESEDRVCNYISIIQGQSVTGRMRLMIVNDELGF